MSPDTLKGRLEIRLSPEDRDAVLSAAKRDGVNKSEWCRRVFANVLGTNATTPTPLSQGVGAGPSEYRRCVERGTHDERHGQCVECGYDYRDVSGANAAQVETGPSGDEGSALAKPSGPTPVPSAYNGGVRPAVQSQTLTACPNCGDDLGTSVGDGAFCDLCAPDDAEAKPERITRPRRADVGPKPEAARKPRPKTGKGKK